MVDCKCCTHEDACNAWIRHVTTLYDDFEYSVEDCPHFTNKTGKTELKSGYCPLCNKVFTFNTNLTMIHCPNCFHHLNLRTPIEDEIDFDYEAED